MNPSELSLEPKIVAVLVGRRKSFGQTTRPSAIFKHPVSGPIRVTKTGLEGDEHGDPKHYGGVDMAVHHYAFEHYEPWRRELPEIAANLITPGAFGENISSRGLDESNVAIGDVFRMGSAVFQVSQGRQPCWSLDCTCELDDLTRRFQESGRTGWCYRVIETGKIAPGDVIERLDRPTPEWNLARVLRVMFVDTLNRVELERMSRLGTLSESWRNIAKRRLEQAETEISTTSSLPPQKPQG
jgi:MOSC domain-containing protein YiiM